MADDDLDFSETSVCSAQSQGVRKNISLKLKGKGRGRGRRGLRGRRSSAKKTICDSVEEEDVQVAVEHTSEDPPSEKPVSDSVSLDEVISKLEAPAFSPMDRAFPEPLHQNKKLRWDYKVNLIGEKVINPMIHCCEICSLPILNYGRLAGCRHVFCYDCAKKADKQCPKCGDNITKVEQAALGTVFMCTFGGTRYGPVPCGRTYLSQRDLQAHINHRHVKPPTPASTTSVSTAATTQVSTGHNVQPSVPASLTASHHPVTRDPRDPRGHAHDIGPPPQTILVTHSQHSHAHPEHREGEHTRSPAIAPTLVTGSNPPGQPRQYPHSPANYSSTIPVSSARPNLITVPIQDDSSATPGQHSHSQAHIPQYTPPQSSAPAHPLPPLQHPPSSYPPPHAYQHPMPATAQTYSQAPPITTQAFTQHPPPPVHHPPLPIRTPSGPLYSTPPPVHHPPPATYSTPPQGNPQHTSHALPPQRFPASSNYEEGSYMQPWNSGGVPPPARAPIPPPRPITAPPPSANHNLGHIPPRGPSEPGYRPPYYQ